MNRRNALALILGACLFALPMAGCSDDPGLPPSGNPEDNWPDEVKASEAARESFSKEAAEKKARGRR